MARAGNLAFADPQRSSGGNDPVFTRLYAETLLRYDGDTIKAYIAESLEQPDTSTVTLKLRKDIKFADGTPVNAEAVKFAVERGKDAKLNAPVRPAMSLIKTVETPDEFTAVLKLERPNALFLSSFAPSSYLVSPTPTWGAMLKDSFALIYQAPWLMSFPGAAIFVLILSLNLLGDGLRDALDPRQRRA